MARLKIEITKNITEVRDITGPLTLGRGKENDILLLNNLVSRKHARVYPEGNETIIEDLNSANGMYVNSTRVFLRALQDRDVIKIGNSKIYFSTEVWDSPPEVVDFVSTPFDEANIEEVINARDVLMKFGSDDESIQKIYEIAREKFALIESISEQERVNLDAALNEAIGNAQRHGHNYNPEMVIEFRYIHKPNDRLVMRVTDQGEGFDYRAELRKKKGSDAVTEARARYIEGGYGGLGILMMLKCVHEVEYNRKGNQVTLTKYLGEGAQEFEEEQKRREEEERKAQAAEEAEGQTPVPVTPDLSSSEGEEEMKMEGGMEISPEEEEDSEDSFDLSAGLEISPDEEEEKKDDRDKSDAGFIIEPD